MGFINLTTLNASLMLNKETRYFSQILLNVNQSRIYYNGDIKNLLHSILSSTLPLAKADNPDLFSS